MARVTKSVEERRQEIITTARLLFAKNGFEKTQMADISKTMNVASGTIFHYFKSKTELLYAVIDEMIGEKMQVKRQLLNSVRGSASDRLIKFFALYGTELDEQSDTVFSNDPAIIQYHRNASNEAFFPIMVTLIKQGNEDGSWSCEYPEETAAFILHGCSGVLSLERGSKGPVSKERERYRIYADFVLRVLGVKP